MMIRHAKVCMNSNQCALGIYYCYKKKLMENDVCKICKNSMFIHSLDGDVPPLTAPSATIEKNATSDPAVITSSILEDKDDDTSCKSMYEVKPKCLRYQHDY